MIKILFSHQNQHSTIECFLTQLAEYKKYQEVEVSVSYYPYQSWVKADDFHFEPYEDYVADLVDGHRSTYQEIHSTASQTFGLLLGGTILAYFLFFNPWLLISVESMVSIFAAYTVGKEIWQDLDIFLQDHTQGASVRWVQQSYYYVLQQFGTLQRFWQKARMKRYGYQLNLPIKIDLISHSNSKTVEMLFETRYFSTQNAEALRILQINFDKKSTAKIHPSQGMIIFRVAHIQKILGMRLVTEYYQALDDGKLGTVSANSHWQPGFSLHKKYLAIGRLWWYLTSTQSSSHQLVMMQDHRAK